MKETTWGGTRLKQCQGVRKYLQDVTIVVLTLCCYPYAFTAFLALA